MDTLITGTSFEIAASTTASFSSSANFASAATLLIDDAAQLNWNQNGTLADMTITAASSSSGYGSIVVGSNYTLTLGSGTSVTGGFNLYGGTGATIVNQGSLTKTASGYYYSYLYAPTLINQGSITANYGALYFGYYSGETTTNATGGTITADGSSTYVYLHNLTNQGTLTAQNGAKLFFTGTTTTANLDGGTINAAGGHAYLNGTLDNTSATLNAPATGLFELYGGTITGGTIAAGALTFTSTGGTLSGVTSTGDFALPDSTWVTFANGTTFTGDNLALGNSSTLTWNQSGTLSGKTITAGSGSSAYATIAVTANNTLTLDSTTTLTGGFSIYGSTGATIVNQGSLTKDSSSYYYSYLYAPTLINQGSITANYGALYFGYYSGETTTNATGGSITADGSGTYVYLHNLANQGTLNAQNSGALVFTGTTTTANLGGTINAAGGHAYLNGTLDNTSATLNAPATGLFELYGGTITGGTIAANTLTFTSSGGTLSGATYTGDFTLPDSTWVFFTNGTTFTGANAVLNNGAQLNWNQNGTLSGKTITAGSGSSAYATIAVGADNTLTLDSTTTLTGGFSFYGSGGSSTIVNQGSITKDSASYYYSYLFAPILINQGSITANSGVLYFGYYSNGSTTNATGGSITADGSGTYVYLNTLNNQGTLTAQNSGALVFTGTTTTANLGGTVNAGGGHAYLNGTLDNTSATLNAPATGLFELYGGTITGGTIAANALTFTSTGGTLSGVTYAGDFTLPDSTYVTLTNGTTVTGGNLALGNSSTLTWNQSGTLSGKTITAGSGSNAYATIAVAANNTLTLDPTTTLTGGFNFYGNTGSTIVNQGSITKDSSSYYYNYLYAPTLINQGSITASSGVLYFGYYSSETTTNATGGSITADGSGTYVYLHNLANQGTLNAQNSGALVFTGTTTTADLNGGTINASGGHAYLYGALDNTSATLNAPATGLFELYGGTITGGTIAANALTFTNYGGTLDGVTYTGDLTLPDSTYASFIDGTDFTGSNMTLGNSAILYWWQSGTLSGKTLNFGTGASLAVHGVDHTLTLDSATTATGSVSIYTDNGSGTAITNQGTLTHTSGYGYLFAPTFVNEGTINATAGYLYLGYYSGENFTNAATGVIHLTGGSVLSGSSNFVNAGLLNIQSGTLYTNSYFTNTSTGTILGSGTIYGGFTMEGGHLAPGNSIGTLTVSSGTMTITAPSILDIELSGSTADELVFQYPGAVVDIGSGLLSLNLTLLGAPTLNTTYTILAITSGSSGLTGTLSGLPNSGDTLTAYYSGTPYTFQVDYLTDSISLMSVPEPGTYALMGAGLALLAFRRRRVSRRV